MMSQNKRGPIGLTKKPVKSQAQTCAWALKTLQADTYTVYLKTQYYHWNVVGPNFHSLHEMFDQQYHDLAEAVDLIAERIRALDELALGSFQEFIDLKTVDEAKANLNALQMVKDLYQTHQAVCKTITQAFSQAAKDGDEASQNMLADRLEAHEKMMWMLKAYFS